MAGSSSGAGGRYRSCRQSRARSTARRDAGAHLGTAPLARLLRGWWEQYSDVLPDNIELLIGLEAEADWEQTYQDAFIPGLLQTP
ncbi:MAG: hypothetical protein ACRDTH_11100, partial [Pseudonocardiaceae bacterium]